MTPSPLLNEEAKAKLAKIKHESFTLKYLPPGIDKPNEDHICTSCPKSMWESNGKTLSNFCKVKHSITWSTKDKTEKILCDDNVPEEEPTPKEEAPQEESPSLEVTTERDLESFITDEIEAL